VDAVLLRSFPYPDPHQLILIFDVPLQQRDALSGISYPDFTDCREQNRVFSEMAGNPFHDLTLTGAGEPSVVERFRTLLLSSFSGLALILTAVGIFGAVSYSASQRTHEIGIRIALGARQREVLWLILGQGAKLALLGLGTGAVVALLLTGLMGGLLYGVSPTDPLTFGTVAIVLLGVAVAACYIPAHRAMRVDPMVALRHE
jgi:predicted lysophospholipase L1 biosynthesis ABC-type transport system permease subunit